MTTRKKPAPTSAKKNAPTRSGQTPSAPVSKPKAATKSAPATKAAAKPATKAAAKPATKSPAKAAPAKAPAKAAPVTANAAKPAKVAPLVEPTSVVQEAIVAPAPVEPEPTPAPAQDAAAAAAPKTTELSATAAAILADPAAPSLVGQQAEMLCDLRANVASQAANVIAQIFATRPELVVPHVSKLAKAIVTKNKRVVQVCAEAMPAIAKVAPARVARELDYLRGCFATSLEDGQDGLVRTFATLCVASVAYQKRLEPVLTEALAIAEGKTLLRWTQIVLPSLKGEPHARARAVVEGRLESLPRPVAQPIADFLGIKLRPRPR